MDKAFVSSVMRGFEAEREAVRQAIESLGLRPLMAELSPASPDPSKHALLSLVEKADAVVLVLGGRYGFVAEHGLSPTEDEYDHAVKTATPVLAFVQRDVEREARQEMFVAKVQGGWGEGAFTGFFGDPNELLLGVVKALASLQAAEVGGDTQSAAQQRAIELAAESDRWGGGQGNMVRAVLVPVEVGVLVDAMVLDDESLGDRAAAVVRASSLVSQAAGIEGDASSGGLVLRAKAPHDFYTTSVLLAADGAVRVETDACADGSLGGMAFLLSSRPGTRARRRPSRPGSLGLAARWRPCPSGRRNDRRARCQPPSAVPKWQRRRALHGDPNHSQPARRS